MNALVTASTGGNALVTRSPSEARTVEGRRAERELSVGLEVEAWLPDLRAALPDLRLLRTNAELFGAVAGAISARIRTLATRRAGGEARARSRGVSADRRDWGRLWTAAADGSIQPSPSKLSREHDDAPFPIEVVSHVMRLDAVDVEEFVDVAAALRQPPLRARTNDSTGFHVHVGRRFGGGFFSFEEVAAVAASWCRFEAAINDAILPLPRRGNAYCRDLRDILALGARRGVAPSAAAAQFHIINVVARLRAFRDAGLATTALGAGMVGNVSRGRLRAHISGDDALIVVKNRGVDDPLTLADGTLVPPGLELVELGEAGEAGGAPDSAGERTLWSRDAAAVGGAGIWRALGVEADGDAPMAALEDHPEALDFDADVDDAATLLSEATTPDAFDTVEVRLTAPLTIEDEDRLLRYLLVKSLLPHAPPHVLAPDPSRYCKLNLTRCGLDAEDATFEFRAFPGDVLERPLATLGWVRFCGDFTAASARGPAPTAGDGPEAELLRFAGLKDDIMMSAWWRECAHRVRPAATEKRRVATNFAADFDAWLLSAKKASFDDADDGPLLDACDRWRSVFAATHSIRQMVSADDASVWGRVAGAQDAAREFVKLLGARLLERLDRHERDLSVRCECAARCGVVATAALCCDAAFSKSVADVRALRAAVEETRGEHPRGRLRWRRDDSLGRLHWRRRRFRFTQAPTSCCRRTPCRGSKPRCRGSTRYPQNSCTTS